MYSIHGLKTFAITGTSDTDLAATLGRKCRIYGFSAHTNAVVGTAVTATLAMVQSIIGTPAIAAIARVVTGVTANSDKVHFGIPLANTDVRTAGAGVYGSFPSGLPARMDNQNQGDIITEGSNTLIMSTIQPVGSTVFVYYTDD